MHNIIGLLPEWLRDEAKDIEPDEWFDIAGAMALVGIRLRPVDLCIAVMPDPDGSSIHTSARIPYPAQGTAH